LTVASLTWLKWGQVFIVLPIIIPWAIVIIEIFIPNSLLLYKMHHVEWAAGIHITQ
jgi:hypothetical protein